MENSHVRLLDRSNTFKICISGEWIIKLKKMGPGLRTSNYPTKEALAFVRQSDQLMLPGIFNPTNLHLGYLKHEIELQSSPVFLACPDGGGNSWAWPLAESVEMCAGPTVTAEEEAPARRQRVIPRAIPSGTTNDEEEGELDEARHGEG